MTQNPQSSRIGAELRALWEKATPLDQARYRLGDPTQVKEYFALLKRKPGGFSVIGTVVNVLADMAKDDIPIESEMRTTPEERGRLSRLHSAIDDHCIERLQRRELVALGYSIPRHPDDLPRIVPAEILTLGHINFGSDSAKGDGLKFEAVRVIPAEAFTEALPVRNRPGRPSNRELIKKAYVACRDEGVIDFAKPQRAAIELVRARIRAMCPTEYGLGKGFGPEVVRDCIVDDFAARARNQKL